MIKTSLVIYLGCICFVLSNFPGINITDALSLHQAVSIQTIINPAAEAVGDINGDGIQDLIITDNGYAVYVMYGNSLFSGTSISPGPASFDNTKGFKLTSAFENPHISRAGDINGDGIDDLVFYERDFDNNAATTYVIFGSKTPGRLVDLDPTQLSNIQSTGRGFRIITTSYFNSLSTAGDINGDGSADILLGVYGKVYVIYGSKVPGFLTDITSTDLWSLNSNSRGFTVGTQSFGYGNDAGDIKEAPYLLTTRYFGC